MLITLEEIQSIFVEHDIRISGVLHVGAHECEELTHYQNLGVEPSDVVWIEAVSSKVQEATNRGVYLMSTMQLLQIKMTKK